MHKEILELPKIELHRHLEGCIHPQFLQSLVQKYEPDHKLNDINKIEELFDYTNFQDFLNAWFIAMGFLRELADFEALARDVCAQLKRENIVYCEFLFSPEPFVENGMDLELLLSIIHETFAKEKIQSRLIIDFVRNFGPTSTESMLHKLIAVLKQNETLQNWVIGISIGGDELNYPAREFKDVFEQAIHHGFRIYAHSGEWASFQSIWDTIRFLKVERIGHGVRAVDDDELVKYLVTKDIGLDISITSNYFTGAVEKDKVHPIIQLMEQGVSISVNTDDPGFFHTDLNKEYQKLYEMGVSLETLKQIPKMALDLSFLSEAARSEIRAYLN
ncbi:MAG: adenosine deaminase [Candidatus Kariarchaeaceae archaeon]